MAVELLTAPEVADRTRLSIQSVRTMSEKGRFPRPVNLGTRMAWVKSEVEDWINERVAARGQPDPEADARRELRRASIMKRWAK